jgi:8-oxo-dGTP pyrophosphatase MutT (NUDIX family)
MAQSRFLTRQYSTPSFVESCGAILFDLSNPTPHVCLIKIISENEHVLPKGRRNINESRKDAAVREIYEETGYRAKLLPVTMTTRATASIDPADVADEAKISEGVTEPFMFTIKELANGGVKIIWWYVAVLNNEDERRGPGEMEVEAEFFACREAVENLHFETDREVLRNAIQIIESTVGLENAEAGSGG